MDTGITIAVILAMITLGALVIYLFNDQHTGRIALRQYSRRLPIRRDINSPDRSQPVATRPPSATAATAGTEAVDAYAHGAGPPEPRRTEGHVEYGDTTGPDRADHSVLTGAAAMSRARPAPGTGDGACPWADGRVEVRIVAANPTAARQVAQVLSRAFVGEEPRSYPAGSDGRGTRLHLTVDTLRTQVPAPTPRTWLAVSHSQTRRTHPDETAT